MAQPGQWPTTLDGPDQIQVAQNKKVINNTLINHLKYFTSSPNGTPGVIRSNNQCAVLSQLPDLI